MPAGGRHQRGPTISRCMWRHHADIASFLRHHVFSAISVDGCVNAIVSHRAVHHVGPRNVCDKAQPTSLSLWCRRPKHALLLSVTHFRDFNVCVSHCRFRVGSIVPPCCGFGACMFTHPCLLSPLTSASVGTHLRHLSLRDTCCRFIRLARSVNLSSGSGRSEGTAQCVFHVTSMSGWATFTDCTQFEPPLRPKLIYHFSGSSALQQ